jgi:uncharacterized protein YggE
MKQLLIGLLLSISIVGFAQTGEKNFIDQNYIEVTGKAEIEIIPDMIFLKIVLSDKNNKDKLPLTEIERVMIEKLSGLEIDVDKNLSVLNFASSLRAQWLRTDVVLTKQYQLIVQDAKTLEKVFFEFQKLGISNVSIVKFDHSQIEQYRKDVKVAAVKAAREKAELLAIALGRTLGNALFVQEADYMNMNQNILSNSVYKSSARGGGTFSQDRYFSSFSGDELSETNIEFEKIKISSTFLVRFGLE